MLVLLALSTVEGSESEGAAPVVGAVLRVRACLLRIFSLTTEFHLANIY